MNAIKYVVGLLLLLFVNTSVRATFISVRLIKTNTSRCTVPPKLFLVNNPSAYTMATQPWYNGESNREIYFEIETADKTIPLETLQIEAEGVTIQRAIVGRTDVAFTKLGNRYQFSLVADTSNGRHVQTAYQNPKGGPFMWIFHNSPERVGGKYLDVPNPETALAAALNYELACQEMLRLMGNMSGLNQPFNGELILLNCESSAPRGHLDFPAHWHLQHWQHGHNAQYGINWREKQYIIPHYYVDSMGNITRNKQSIHQYYQTLAVPKKEFLPGDTCVWKDVEGNLIFKQIIQNGGMQFITTTSAWRLQPDPSGGQRGVWIYKNQSPVAKVQVDDNGEKGSTAIQIEYIGKNKQVSDTWRHVINYDPFTGK
jgi:hypothetical protein